MIDRRSLLLQTKCALDDVDIEGLLAMHCPPDEYDSEASMIGSRIFELISAEERLSVAQITEIISQVWNSQFGPFANADIEKRQAAFELVAEKISRSL